jgi:hypothetical protein
MNRLGKNRQFRVTSLVIIILIYSDGMMIVNNQLTTCWSLLIPIIDYIPP